MQTIFDLDEPGAEVYNAEEFVAAVLRTHTSSQIIAALLNKYLGGIISSETEEPEKMNAEALKNAMAEYLTTNFGTSDEPSYPSMRQLNQLVYEVEQDVEEGRISEPV